MPLQVTYQGKVDVVDDDVTALIGSDAASTIRIVRPGISRRHAVVSYDGTAWKIEDAGSRNGTFKDGQRVQIVSVDEPMTIYLGHPTDGEAITLTPGDAGVIDEPSPIEVDDSIQDEVDEFVLPATPAAPVVVATTTPTMVPEEAEAPPAATPRMTAPSNASDADLAALTAALRDQISAVKGLTWSVWAMIAVTAALAVMTLFVGVLGS